MTNEATRLAEQARILSKRLREQKVTHHQISEDREPYRTAIKTHPVETIKLEAADLLDALATLAQPAVSEDAGWQPIETAPKRFHPPLSLVNHHAPQILGLYGQAFYCICSWGGPYEPFWIGGDNKRIPFQPTRWMRLPPAMSTTSQENPQ